MFKHAAILAVIAVWLLALQLTSTAEQSKGTIEEPKTYAEARKLAEKTPGKQNLLRIGLALHGYKDFFGKFPPSVLVGPDGKTPYSWRVELLPILKHYADKLVDKVQPDSFPVKFSREQYNKLIANCGYDIRQPWDSPKNREVLKAIPKAYRHPSDSPDSVDAAFYAVVGPGTAFDPKSETRFTDIKGWPATTLMIVESRSREPWTKPIDIAYSPSSTVPRFGGFTKNGFLASSCDGATHFVSDKVSPENLRAFISKEKKGTITIEELLYKYPRGD